VEKGEGPYLHLRSDGGGGGFLFSPSQKEDELKRDHIVEKLLEGRRKQNPNRSEEKEGREKHGDGRHPAKGKIKHRGVSTTSGKGGGGHAGVALRD